MSASTSKYRISPVSESDLSSETRAFLIDRQARGLSPRTIEFYEDKLDIVLGHLARQGVDQVTQIRPIHVRAMLVQLRETHRPGGVHAIYRALRAFLRWWETEVEPQDWSNPLAKVPAPRVDDPPLDPVPLVDLRAMLATCQRRTFYGERDRAMMLFLLDSGLRRGELRALNVADITMVTGSVLVRRGKGGKARTAFIGSKTRRALIRYLRFRPDISDAAPLWVTIEGTRLSCNGMREILLRRAKRAGVPATSLHAFRRAFAISALRAGCDLITLQRMLGHSSLAVINRYLRQVEEDLRVAHEKVGPVDNLL